MYLSPFIITKLLTGIGTSTLFWKNPISPEETNPTLPMSRPEIKIIFFTDVLRELFELFFF